MSILISMKLEERERGKDPITNKRRCMMEMRIYAVAGKGGGDN